MELISIVRIAEMSIMLVLFLVFAYLNVMNKQKYSRIWTLTCGLFFTQRAVGFLNAVGVHFWALRLFRLMLYWIALYMFIYGVCKHIKKPMNKWWIKIWIILSIFSIAMYIYSQSRFVSISLSCLGICFMWGGIDILKGRKEHEKGRAIVGYSIIIWGFIDIWIYYILNNTLFGKVVRIADTTNMLLFTFGILILHYETLLNNIQKSKDGYKCLIENIPNGIFVEVDRKNVFSNKAAQEILKAENKEVLLGMDIYGCMLFNNKENVGESFENVTYGEAYPLKELKMKRLDHTFVEIEGIIIPIMHNGKEARLLIVKDITGRKEAEVLNQKIEEKTKQLKDMEELERVRNDFFANISHELRTPLNIILGTLQLRNLKNEEKDKNYIEEKHIMMIQQNSYRLLRLINNLIDITKIDSGFYELNLVNCNIVNIVEQISQSVADYIKNRGIEFIFDTDVEEKILDCDLDKMERIMLNLLSNAIKFSKKGGTIAVSIQEHSDSIKIIVKDEGIGIPKEMQSIVFQRFKQVDNIFSRGKEGSGIGLSLVKLLVEMHGGTITLDSELGKGSEFTIEIPNQVTSEKNITEEVYMFDQMLIERINVEFSDIYAS